MEATIVTGPYGSGKTTTINRILPASIKTQGKVGIIVSESAAIALDGERYHGINQENVHTIPFGTVCCPNRELLEEALANALDKRNYDHVYIEPAGNVDSRDIIDIALSRDIQIARILGIVNGLSWKAHTKERSFQTAMHLASTIFVTKVPSGGVPDLESLLNEWNPTAQHILVPEKDKKTPFSTDLLESLLYFSYDRLGISSQSSEHAHFNRSLVVIDPTLGRERIKTVLEKIASKQITRGKGEVPQLGMRFDIEGSRLTIDEIASDPTGMATGFFADQGKLPLDLIKQITYTASSRDSLLNINATSEDRLAAFGASYEDAKNVGPYSAGKVVAHFEPADIAFQLAREIYVRDTNPDPLRMALIPKVGSRIKALKALEKSKQEDGVAVGMDAASQALMFLEESDGIDYPSLLDMNQRGELTAIVAPSYIEYLNRASIQDIATFPDYREKSGERFIKRARIAGAYSPDKSLKRSAQDNMSRVNEQAGYASFAQQWSELQW